jgi:hypothetical protein
MSNRLRHDFCHAVASRVVELFRSLLRDEEARDAYAEVYEVTRQEAETYARAKARQDARLRPLTTNDPPTAGG